MNSLLVQDSQLNEFACRCEALLFASEEPLSIERFQELLETDNETIQAALERLKSRLAEGSALCVAHVAGGYRLETKPEYLRDIRGFVQAQKKSKLSMAALETLALIAYKQPITAVEIAEMRMVSSVGPLIKNLLEKKFIKMAGRKQVVGRPMMYRTTKEFLVHFGLNHINDLPSLEEFAKTYAAQEEADLPAMESEEA